MKNPPTRMTKQSSSHLCASILLFWRRRRTAATRRLSPKRVRRLRDPGAHRPKRPGLNRPSHARGGSPGMKSTTSSKRVLGIIYGF
ncbi:hypothetical protein JTE90_003212 [Oedothorax gibbosus]|uniref:Uncharacterized protein n=1 Tax=Oedothorax gibbosus TaxID=931172 RepID=A0AAV6TM98_9ARAC|nr:hypothetical protein JTE90_003212 [Oedothorax gibbosus]